MHRAIVAFAVFALVASVGGAPASGSRIQSPAVSVMSVRPDGTGRVVLLSGAWSPLASPAGDRFLFFSARGVNVANADGTSHRLVVQENPVLFHDLIRQPTWSPDGTQIAYERNNQIDVATIADGRLRLLYRPQTTVVAAWGIAWARDGRVLASLSGPEDVPIKPGVYGIPDVSLVAVDASTGTPTFLTRHSHEVPGGGSTLDSGVAPSPDGRRLAFTRVTETLGPPVRTTRALYIADARGGGARRLRIAARSRVSWSPDSAFLAYSDAWGTKIFDVRRGRVRGVVQRGFEQPSWSPDGSRLATAVWRTDRNGHRTGGRIIVFDRRTGRARTVYDIGDAGAVASPTWVDRGTRVVFTVDPLLGGEPGG